MQDKSMPARQPPLPEDAEAGRPGARLDSARLAELRRLLLLDSGAERAYDEITRLLATSLAVPITMVNLLDAERDWFKSCVGIQQTQAPAVTSFCEVFFTTDEALVVVEDTLNDGRFNANPMVVGRPFIRFYAAARLSVRGHTIGTLCAYDVRPRRLSAGQLADLQTMANAAADLIGQRVAGERALSAANAPES